MNGPLSNLPLPFAACLIIGCLCLYSLVGLALAAASACRA